MVNLDDKLREAQPLHNARHQGDDFRIRADASDANNIGIHLPKFAITSPLWPLAAEDRRDVIALEGEGDLALMLRDHARQRHRQVIAHRQGLAFAAAVPRCVDELLGILAIIAEERRVPLQHGGGERLIAVALEDLGDGVQHGVAPQHRLGQKIAKSLRIPRLDGVFHIPLGLSFRARG